MIRKFPPMVPAASCEHAILNLVPSPHASDAGYTRPTEQQRAIAAGKGKKDVYNISPVSFPAPLVLVEDDLAQDPQWPPQSLRSWVREKERNEVRPEKNVIYVVGPPDIASGSDYISTWTRPHESCIESPTGTFPELNTTAVVEYLAAFYHGLPVKLLESPGFSFTDWEESGSQASKRTANIQKLRFIGLNIPTETIRIRTRATPEGVFARQLNLDDLLDAAIAMLPDDAYALLMLVQHDIYENEEDDFACGRAYGGSRIAVVSTARYNPLIDGEQDVEREHAWPASHCNKYIQATYSAASKPSLRPKKKAKVQVIDLTSGPSSHSSLPLSSSGSETLSPLKAAVLAYSALPFPKSLTSPSALSGLWLARVCRTASHELGHCLGMDHCVYYACSMQGTASLAEDVRQPPYLCPVDLAKVLRATGADMNERYAAILSFCEKYKDNHLFAAYGEWVRSRLLGLDTTGLKATMVATR